MSNVKAPIVETCSWNFDCFNETPYVMWHALMGWVPCCEPCGIAVDKNAVLHMNK
jgi:hypothetical protein